MLMNKPSCVSYFLRNEAATVRLFCFHYAGGNANVFNKWHAFLPKNLEVVAIQLPGRMSLSTMRPCTDIGTAITYLSKNILSYLIEKPFIFFGHSLGGLISFELARFMQTYHGITPRKLITTACRPPRKPRGEKKISTLSEQGIIEELIAYNHTPRELLENSELMQIALPIIRADFAINESYSYQPGQLLNCPITVYGGIDDSTVKQRELDDWCIETKDQFKLQMFSGDHFFVFKQQQSFLHQLRFELEND